MGRDPLRVRIDQAESNADAALLLIEEDGQTLALSSAAPQRRISTPPRLGVIVLRIDAATTLQLRPNSDGNRGIARLTLICDAESIEQKWEWFGLVEELDQALRRGVGSSAAGQHEAALSAIEAAAPDPRSRVWASHLRAQGALVAGQSRSAVEAFLAVAEAWAQLGESARGLAARTAALEERNRLGEYAEVLAARQPVPADPGPAGSYYDARAQVAKCLAARYLSRFDEATVCYDRALHRFDTLGTTQELAVAALDYGTIELDRGRLGRALELFGNSRELLGGPGLGDERGRAEFFLGWAQMRRGDIATALQHLQRAVAEFESSGSDRWLGSTLMRLGGWLAELGAYADANAVLAEGMARFDERNAPGRIAAGAATQARIALATGRHAQAQRWAERSERLYLGLDQVREAESAALLAGRALLAQGDAEGAARRLQSLSAQGDPEARLLRVELQLHTGQLEQAKEALDRLAPKQLATIEQRRRRSVLAVALLEAQGEVPAALEALREAHRQLKQQVAEVRSPLLRDRLLQEQAAYARRAVDLLAAAPADVLGVGSQALDALLAWLPVIDPPDDRRPRAPGPGAQDAALARALFPSLVDGGAAPASSARALLDALASTGSKRIASQLRLSPNISSTVLQRVLTDDESWLILIEGEAHLALAHLQRDALQGPIFLPREPARAAAEQLSDALSSADTPITRISSAALALRQSLRLDARLGPTEAKLRILAAGAWAALPWPLLLEDNLYGAARRPVSVVTLGGRPLESPPALPGKLVALAAADFSGSTLPGLPAARGEAQSISSFAASATETVAAIASRQAILDALQIDRGWVHLASHGSVAPGRLGGAGLWLQSSTEHAAPGYLSGLEILEARVKVDLVVLNACRLGADGSHMDSSTRVNGFSALLLHAGARQVVAALWTVSDTAGAMWVDSFYRAALAEPDRITEAVATARQRLADSRAFRHPHHWAGLVHYQMQPLTARP